MRPFLRWAGSKRQILRLLRSYWRPRYARYIEPFAGSACLFFELEPNCAVLGDINWELICTMRAVRDSPDRVLELLRGIPTGKDTYYLMRKINPRPLSESEIAARFIYLNRFCFNGLYRTNLRGEFNVPYGPPKTRWNVDGLAVTNASRILRNATLINADFAEALADAREGDFVYLDPPYLVAARRVFSEYQPKSFTEKDLHRLGIVLHGLNARGVHFLITYADSREARSLLESWNPRRIRTRRNIAGFAGSRRFSYELVATNRPGGE